ncbi:hypothetical protein Tco_1294352 [Tanacetum coccineum]
MVQICCAYVGPAPVGSSSCTDVWSDDALLAFIRGRLLLIFQSTWRQEATGGGASRLAMNNMKMGLREEPN